MRPDYIGTKRKSSEWANYVRELRGRLGCNQRQFAALVDLDPSYICRMERSHWVPGFYACQAIADKLCLDRAEVLLAAGYYESEAV